LSKLQDEGMIGVQNKLLVLNDLPRLKQIVERNHTSGYNGKN
jgi:hypothetical protein